MFELLLMKPIKVSLTLRELSPRLSLWKHSVKPVRCGRTYYASLVVLLTCQSVYGHFSSGSGIKAAPDFNKCPRMIPIL